MSDTTHPPGGGEALSALLHETRHFDPPPGFVTQANAQPGIYELAGQGPRRLVDRAGRGIAVGPCVPKGARVGPSFRQVVRGRQAQCLGQLRRPSRRGRTR